MIPSYFLFIVILSYRWAMNRFFSLLSVLLSLLHQEFLLRYNSTRICYYDKHRMEVVATRRHYIWKCIRGSTDYDFDMSYLIFLKTYAIVNYFIFSVFFGLKNRWLVVIPSGCLFFSIVFLVLIVNHLLLLCFWLCWLALFF